MSHPADFQKGNHVQNLPAPVKVILAGEHLEHIVSYGPYGDSPE